VLKRFFLFGFVGIVGFLVDTGVLYLIKDLCGLYLARIFSFIAAVFTTWVLNRLITFKQDGSGLTRLNEFFAYFFLMLFGGMVNYLTFALLVAKFEFVIRYPIVGVAAGSIAGLIVNFLTANNLYQKNLIKRFIK
jgi:putative flippase GtrA